jgi:poly(A) polymerase
MKEKQYRAERVMGTGERETALAVVRRLRERRFEAYFVGGCVRDMLMGRESREHDVATSARPEEVAAVFPHIVFVGKPFGVVLVVEGGHCVHVATFRADLSYRDGRKPTAVRFSSAREDVRRRDFTVNGLLYDPLEDRLLDFVEGRRDIEARVIRTIGDPAQRFAEDKLRLLRAVRFASTLGFRIEPGTFAVIKALAGEIRVVSQERISEELVKIMVGPRAGAGLGLLDETGLLAILLPEVYAMKGVPQPLGFHPEGDVFEHTQQMLDAMSEPSVVLAFAVLLHDVGKPRTVAVGDRIRFPRHQTVGAEIAREVCARLRFPNDVRDKVVACVENHMVFMDVKRMRESTLRRLMSRPTFETELELHRLDCGATDRDLSALEFLEKKRKEYGEQEIRPAPLITGRDLLDRGYEEGPLIGRMLHAVEEMQLENRLKTRDEALEWVARQQWS